MSLRLSTPSAFLNSSPQDAWKQIGELLWNHFSAPLSPKENIAKTTVQTIVQRDRNLAELDNLLAGSAWSLWGALSSSLSNSLTRGSAGVIDFWNTAGSGANGKAVLILDGLSLREIPFLLHGAEKRKLHIRRSGTWTAELPAATTQYANALGFPQRSSLANNKTISQRLPGAWTESSDLPFYDCANALPPEQSILFWHHWLDSKMHDLAKRGLGLEALAKEVGEKLASDDFWTFIERLASGRTLLITSDHGYAATGHFHDLSDKAQSESLQSIFKGQRYAKVDDNTQPLPWIPPLDLTLESAHGKYRYVLGRRKWKSHGGYPILQHGGLSLLEMFVPFLEIVK